MVKDSARADKRLGYALKRAQSALRHRMDQALRPLDLTAPQYAVLATLEAEPGISSAGLARAAFVTPQTMGRMVAGLEQQGLLAREAHPDHGRVRRSILTARGQEVLRQAHRVTMEIEEKMLSSMSSEDISWAISFLETCADNLGSDAGN